MGKGSSRRKEDTKKIEENWDRIFGRKDGKDKSDTTQPKKTKE
jgi:hypothetical protein